MRISIGHVEPIRVTMEGRCGGAVVERAKKHLVVNSENILTKMMRNMKKAILMVRKV